jgi:hypothetical protein
LLIVRRCDSGEGGAPIAVQPAGSQICPRDTYCSTSVRRLHGRVSTGTAAASFPIARTTANAGSGEDGQRSRTARGLPRGAYAGTWTDAWWDETEVYISFHSSPAYIGRNDARESCRVRSVWPRRRPRNERRPRVVVWRANGRDPTRIRDVREGHRVAPRVRGEGSAAARVAAVFRLGSRDGRELKNLDGDTPNSTRPAVPTISRKPTTPGVTCDKTGTRRGTGRAMRRNGRQFRRRRRRGRRSSQRTAKKHHKHKPRNPQSPRRAAPASSANKTLQSTSARRTWTRLTSLVTASF